ncbi:MAG: extracellular solute-binding protein [Pseudomonadota bacterium]|nr:extracellular solute-binding protein [Pseudomonadota bacterium]
MKRVFCKNFKRLYWFFIFVVSILTTGTFVSSKSVIAQELNIYSHRQPFLIKPFTSAFRKITGVKVNVVFAAKGLVQRLKAEGSRSPADLILTVDIARLDFYAQKGLFTPVASKVLNANIPSYLREKNNLWYALSKRARVLAIAKGRVKPNEIKRIEDLEKPEWKGKICTRKGSHVYNRALLSSIIAANGKMSAEKWVKGLISNLARRPQGNDRAQIKAIAQGVCDVAIINHYYFFKMKNSKNQAQRDWVKSVRILFLNQGDRGNHINVTGIGVAKHSKNKNNAIRFMEFLSNDFAQNLYAKINYEYPIKLSVKPSVEVLSLGKFKEDQLPIGLIAKLAPDAQKIINRVGW